MYDSWVAYRRTPSRRNLQRFHVRALKFWDQFDEYDSQKLRCVKQKSEKAKVHRWKKYKSNFLNSAVPTLRNLRTDLRRRLKDKGDAPAETRGDLPRISISSKKRKKLHFFAHRWVDFAGSIHNKTGGKRVCGGLWCKHVYGQQERPQLCRIGNRTGLWKSNDGGTSQRRRANKRRGNSYVRELNLFVTVMLLEDTPAVLSLGKLCEDHGYNYHWTSGQKPHLIKNGRKIDCNSANYVPIVIRGLSTSSSSSSSPTSPTS